MTKIETERLILRNITEDDAFDIFEYGREANVGPNAGWKPHENIEETREIMKQVFLNQQYVFGIVLKENNKMIGSIGLIKDPKRENPYALMLGYAISEKYWRRGIVTEASKAVIDFGFKDPEVDIITCCCYSFNQRSRRVIEKCGFKYEGCLRQGERRYDGEVFDIESFSLLKEEV
ncbi:MAG TPA: GNAT family protein [Xylanibacter oryzae]|uniref:GNAT family N-acetyltransferase n=1 Tax=Xylanibacter oryzae TaxID=185293 RepID=UPI0004BC251D|nr:GNAT family protein [Xylanibacter oryzae]HRN16333.1 GNAT family protein [Xylanibacter oryzae]